MIMIEVAVSDVQWKRGGMEWQKEMAESDTASWYSAAADLEE